MHMYLDSGISVLTRGQRAFAAFDNAAFLHQTKLLSCDRGTSTLQLDSMRVSTSGALRRQDACHWQERSCHNRTVGVAVGNESCGGKRQSTCNRCKQHRVYALASAAGKEVSSLDVSDAVISPSFRSTPWEAERIENNNRSAARIVFVSESNVCRSALAEGIMAELLHNSELKDQIEFTSRGTRDYNIGEGPEPTAVAAAEDLSITLPPEFAARRFDFENDTVHYDMILVMDKYTAADVMREISVYDTINKHGKYTQKVRRLGEFHPTLKDAMESDGQDIDDPLYGNDGDAAEAAAVRQTAITIKEACQGLLAFLEQVRERDSNASLYELLRTEMQGMKELDWLVPPMLQPR